MTYLRSWPLLGMFAIGLLAGAIGSYAVTQRPQIRRLASRALRLRKDFLGELGRLEDAKPLSVTSRRANNRREADVEVTR